MEPNTAQRQREAKLPSLKNRLIQIVLLCWVIPVVAVGIALLYYTSVSLSEKTLRSYEETAAATARIVTERMDGAVEASRQASYEMVIKRAFQKYRRTGARNEVLSETLYFLRNRFRTDERFLYAIMWYWDNPPAMNSGVNNESLGVRYEAMDDYWQQDHQQIVELASRLDTGVAFLNCQGRIYLVRNVMDGQLKSMATLVLALNQDYFFSCFGDMLLWGDCILLRVNGETLLSTVSEEETVKGTVIGGQLEGLGYTLEYALEVDNSANASQTRSYQIILAAMLTALIPLIFIAVRFFYEHINRPLRQMAIGAREIELGNFGYQLRRQSRHRELRYLEGSFNQMSLQLEDLFHRIYAEELALRDAKIKALQSQINPHFLNNTLEIINWESRMSGDVKVSHMIEALSTMLDAAMARDGRKSVPLSEEMMYVDAYLYIIGERLGKRLTVVKEIDQSLLECMVPRLILQPIIENAVEHGITPRQQGTILLRVEAQNKLLLLEIRNDGVMTSQDQAEVERLLGEEDPHPQTSVRIGIRNVHQRLQMMYGTQSGLTIAPDGAGQVAATIRIPLDKVKRQ